MKKTILFIAAAVLTIAACQKNEVPTPSKDEALTGEKVDVSTLSGVKKLFVLNEGQMGVNNATLDMLRVSDGNYITGVFKKMNPQESAGLGDVANDILVVGNEVWIAVNNSGIVDVLSAVDETEIAAIQLAMPRSLAFDDKYVYVSSWNGAVAIYGADWSVDPEQSKNPKGVVYRIDRSTHALAGSVEVGYQPEGLAVYDGKLYVANSGGISSSLPPAYSYDNTVSVIDTKTFTVTKTLEVEINIQKVFSDGKGNIYVTTFGNYYSVHSGLWCIKTADDSVSKVADYASIAAFDGETVYCIGNENEFDYTAAFKAVMFKCAGGVKADWSLPLGNVSPYGLAALPGDNIIVSESDYVNPGKLNLFHGGEKVWSVTSGVNPNHFAIY